MGLQVGGSCARAALVARQDNAGPFVGQHVLQVLGEQLDAAAPGGELAHGEMNQVFQREIIAAACERIHQYSSAQLELLQGVGPGFAKFGQAAAEHALLQIALDILAPLPENGAHALLVFQRLAAKDQRIAGQVIKQRGYTAVKQGDVFVGTAEGKAVFQLAGVLAQRVLCGCGMLAAQRVCQAAQPFRQRAGAGGQRLHGRRQDNFLNRIGASLGLKVEKGERVDSRRTGLGAPGVKMSRMPPRSENCPAPSI